MDFLPEMIPAPAKPSPEPVIKEPGELTDHGPPPEVIREDSVVQYEDDLPEPVPKSILRNDEVFRNVKKKVEISQEPDLVVQPIQGSAPPAKLTKKGRAKRPASDKQKEHLKKARIKALETRRRNKKERDEANGIFEDDLPEPTPPPPVPDNPPEPKPKAPKPDPVPVKPPEPEPPMQFLGYTQEEMNEAVFSGIQRYDGKRKKEKKEKKARLAQEEHDRRVVQSIQKAVGPTHQSDPWSSLFTFN